MKRFLTRKKIIITSIILVFGGGLVIAQRLNNKPPEWTTETVSRGEVSNVISVSGTLKALNSADLSFPTTGVVSQILVHEGDTVKVGQLLATLEQQDVVAQKNDASGALLIAEANKAELVGGATKETRSLTDIDVDIARANLERTKAEEESKVRNAYRTLLSDGLEAEAVDSDNGNIPPVVSGTYQCTNEGTYRLSVFNSNSYSNYSFRLSGLETGTYNVSIGAPASFGTCGLSLQFDKDQAYSTKDWVISIPNTRSVQYVANLNAYTLARQQQTNNVAAATQALEKALRNQSLQNAVPRNEALVRADANIVQAQARIAQINALIGNRTLRAPFDGVIGKIYLTRGETFSGGPALTLVTNNAFALTVRIPEIDIAKVAIGQSAEVLFDATKDDIVPATITFISPEATQIDGVAYFEAKLRFENTPHWFRGGLNADANIIIERKSDVLRIPKRFLIESNGSFSVLVPQGTKTATTAIETKFTGNNGYVEITGLNQGDTVIAP